MGLMLWGERSQWKPWTLAGTLGMQVFPEVSSEMLPYLTTHFGNPSSIHTYGRHVGMGYLADCTLLSQSADKQLLCKGSISFLDVYLPVRSAKQR
jgi:hypothetical protein